MRGIMYGTPMLSKLLNDTDIALITEHWLLPEQMNFLNTIDNNFKAYGVCDARIALEPENRKCNRGFAGIAFMWRKDMAVSPILNEGNDRVVCCSVQLRGNSHMFIIGALMPSTNVSKKVYVDTLRCVSDLYDRFSQQGHVILMGDFNAQINKSFGIKNHQKSNERGKILQTFINERHLISVNSQVWTKGMSVSYVSKAGLGSLIDHVFIENSKIDCVCDCTILDDHYLNVSDHLPIRLRYELPVCLSKHVCSVNSVNWKKCTAKQKLEYAQNVSRKLCEKDSLRAVACDVHSLENKFKNIISCMHEAAKKTLPMKKYRSFLKPYWKYNQVKALHASMREKRLLWIAEGRPRGMDSDAFREYKLCKRMFVKELEIARSEYERKQLMELAETAEVDVGTFYKVARSRQVKGYETSELRVNGKISRDADVNRKAWTNHYSELASVIEKQHFDPVHRHQIDSAVHELRAISYLNANSVCQGRITEQEVLNALKDMKDGKAGGHDYIVLEHIRFGGAQLLKLITQMFNVILEIEDYPLCFKHGIVISLFKGGKKDRLDVNNYRDITLTPVLQRIFEKVLYQRISKVCTKINFPHRLQQGFRSKCGRITAAFTVREAICHHLELNTKVYAAFLDNAKAFNSVWINGLLFKLYNLGFNGKIWRILANSFEGVTSYVLYEGKKGTPYPVEQGVGQGRTLSAWLFLVMINDLISELDSSSYGLNIHSLHIPAIFLADDTLLMDCSVGNLKCLLDMVYEFSRKWRLNYNPVKSSLMQFHNGTSKHIPRTECKLGEHAIAWVTVKEYAGITLTSNLRCDENIKTSCKKREKVVEFTDKCRYPQRRNEPVYKRHTNKGYSTVTHSLRLRIVGQSYTKIRARARNCTKIYSKEMSRI
ncbi:uncharacterized protein LOC132565495 [Ylistrum balloti]|uniref:uncharacterized protein LOC132565495 n=1 Tax=Ylistrum balloti TaxID=509963 RepID=UPI002905AA7A|nr:uncharacterized protein LOC132565495 [Ylistrum balloti]